MARGLIALEEDRARAEPLLSQLRANERQWRDLTELERQVLSRGPLIDFLLETSYSLRFDNPPAMLSLARAACAVADRMGARRYGKKVLADLRARAWAELGNAHRVVEDLEEAGVAYGRAQELVGEGTRSSPLLARVSELMAHYFTDLRHFSEAASLLERSNGLYVEIGDGSGVERSLLSLAHVLTQANEPERAVIAYLRALHRIAPDSPHLLASIHGMALNLVESGHPEIAQNVLNRHRRLYRRSGRLNEYRLFWLEGKIAIGLKNYGKAEAKLNTARLAFLHVEKVGDAALVSLDLAWLYAKEGRRSEVAWLVDQMLRTFRALGIARESIASLLLLKKSCEQERPIEALCGQIEALAKLMPELRQRKRREADRGLTLLPWRTAPAGPGRLLDLGSRQALPRGESFLDHALNLRTTEDGRHRRIREGEALDLPEKLLGLHRAGIIQGVGHSEEGFGRYTEDLQKVQNLLELERNLAAKKAP
jgi:tetratricopeptide (TPR) repeat protein